MLPKIPFSDLSGTQFERLVYAYVFRTEAWFEINWLGRGGNEGGRDIWGKLFNGYSHKDRRALSRTVCIQCKNLRNSLSSAEIKNELDKLKDAIKKQPDEYWLYGARTTVNAQLEITDYARSNNAIKSVKFFSEAEFEERLWTDTAPLARRAVSGLAMNLTEEEITRAGEPDFKDWSEADLISRLIPIFNRNAFRIPAENEASMYSLLDAIEDTTRALQTGVWTTRESRRLGTVPQLSYFATSGLIEPLQNIDFLLADLHVVATALIQHYTLPDFHKSKSTFKDTGNWRKDMCHLIDDIRREIEREIKKIYPKFKGLV